MSDIWELLLKWAYHNKFVDEVKALFLIFSALTNRKPIMVEGTTGSGKTMSLKLLFKLIPDDWVVTVRDATEAVVKRMKWDDVVYLFIPELQNFSKHEGNVEMIKTITEGDDYVSSRMVGKTIVPFTVPCTIVPVMSIAYENRAYRGDTGYNKDAEFHRRVPRVHLSIDPIHINTVKKENARRRYFKSKFKVISDEDRTELEEMVQLLIMNTTQFPLTNPFQEHLVDYFPNHTTATSSHTETYADFAEGFARLRLIGASDGSARRSTYVKLQNGKADEDTYLMTLQDVAFNHAVFGEECVRNILGIPYLGIEILRQFDKEELGEYQGKLYDDGGTVSLTLRQICNGLKEEGFVIDMKYVRMVLENMEDNWHISSDNAKDAMMKKYSRVLDQQPNFDVDWVRCWEAAMTNLKQDLDEDTLAKWVEYQRDDNGDITWRNPLKEGEIEMLVTRGEIDA